MHVQHNKKYKFLVKIICCFCYRSLPSLRLDFFFVAINFDYSTDFMEISNKYIVCRLFFFCIYTWLKNLYIARYAQCIYAVCTAHRGQSMCEENKNTNWIWSRKLHTINNNCCTFIVVELKFTICCWFIFLSVLPSILIVNAVNAKCIIFFLRIVHSKGDSNWSNLKCTRSRNHFYVIQIMLFICATTDFQPV